MTQVHLTKIKTQTQYLLVLKQTSDTRMGTLHSIEGEDGRTGSRMNVKRIEVMALRSEWMRVFVLCKFTSVCFLIDSLSQGFASVSQIETLQCTSTQVNEWMNECWAQHLERYISQDAAAARRCLTPDWLWFRTAGKNWGQTSAERKSSKSI